MAEGGGGVTPPEGEKPRRAPSREIISASSSRAPGLSFGGLFDSTLGKLLTALLVLVLLIVGAIAYLAATYEPGPPGPRLKVPNVKPYSGPVAFAGMKDVYARARHVTSCVIPDDLASIDRPDRPLRPTARQRINAAIEGIEEVRMHKFKKRPKINFPSRPEFDRKLISLATKEYKRAEAVLTSKALAALGAIPPNTNPFRPTTESASAIAGFYLPESEEIFVGGIEYQGANLLDELTLAHELEHALVDDVFGLPSLEHPPPGKIDSAQAARAVIEGDAVISAEQYALVLGNELERLVVSGAQAALFQDTGGTAPYFLSRSFIFPYFEGALFVCNLYAINGWNAVDEAYRDPPKTTADILFPVRYTVDIKPQDPTDPKKPKGWKALPPKAFGAADLLWLFQAPGGQVNQKLSRDASPVARWNGGELHIYKRGSGIAIALALVDGGQQEPEKKRDKEELITLCQRTRRWMEAGFPSAGAVKLEGKRVEARMHEGRVVALVCNKEGPRFVSAPDRKTAQALVR